MNSSIKYQKTEIDPPRLFSIHPNLVKFFPTHEEALFFTVLLDYYRYYDIIYGLDDGDFFPLSYSLAYKLTGIKPRQQKQIIDKLLAMNLIVEVELLGMPRELHYWIDYNDVTARFQLIQKGDYQNGK